MLNFSKVESVKLPTLRAKNVLTCLRTLRTYVLTCFCAYVITYLACLPAHMPTRLA